MTWRTTPLPADWQTRRTEILLRDDHRCTAWLNQQRCVNKATDVDHINPAHLGGSDEPNNLASLCGWHHKQKTAREAQAAKQHPHLLRPEPHPSLAAPR